MYNRLGKLRLSFVKSTYRAVFEILKPLSVSEALKAMMAKGTKWCDIAKRMGFNGIRV